MARSGHASLGGSAGGAPRSPTRSQARTPPLASPRRLSQARLPAALLSPHPSLPPPCPLPAPSLPPLQERQLDLVLIADKSEPVICKIVSYDKFRFNKEKKKKEQARRSPRWRLQSEAAV